MSNFEIQVLETIKQVKLNAENTINEKETEEKVGKKTEPETRKTGRGRRQIDRIKKDYETAKTPEEKLNIIQSFINNVYQGAEATQEEIDFFNNEIEALKKEGFELDMNFQPGVLSVRGEGDVVDVIAQIPDDTLPEGVEIISHVMKPGIVKNGKILNRAQIQTRKGTRKDTKREELVKEKNKAQDMPLNKDKRPAMQKANKALSEYDSQFINPFNLADLAGKESKVESAPIDKKEYEVHLEGNYGDLGWQVYDKLSVEGVKVGDIRNYSSKSIDFMEKETDTNKIFTIIDRTVYDHVGRPGATTVSMVFPKNTSRTLSDVKENLLNLNAEIQATKENSQFSSFARSAIERMDLKEIATPDINIETVTEKETSKEEVIVVE